MKRFLAAIRFLTIIPVPGTAGTDEGSLAESVAFFPLVGLLLGGLAAGAAFGLTCIAPPMVAAALLVCLLVAFSGGLHLDGLSDMADGFFSARPRERILEIMKDSHVGAMGVIAIVCVLMVKFAALSSVAAASTRALWMTAFMLPLCGRCAMMLPMAMLDYVRPEGLGRIFHKRSLALIAVVGVVALILGAIGWGVVCGVLWAAYDWRPGLYPPNLLLPAEAAAGTMLVGALAAVLAVLLLTAWSRKKIGGATGDVYGASCEVAELAATLALAGWRW